MEGPGDGFVIVGAGVEPSPPSRRGPHPRFLNRTSIKANATRSASPAKPPTTPPTTVLVGAAVEVEVEVVFEDPEGAVVDEEEGVAYTPVAPEPSLPPASYVDVAESEYDDHPVDDGSAEAELP